MHGADSEVVKGSTIDPAACSTFDAVVLEADPAPHPILAGCNIRLEHVIPVASGAIGAAQDLLLDPTVAGTLPEYFHNTCFPVSPAVADHEVVEENRETVTMESMELRA